jgi:hypothetical protein
MMAVGVEGMGDSEVVVVVNYDTTDMVDGVVAVAAVALVEEGVVVVAGERLPEVRAALKGSEVAQALRYSNRRR